jgi:hypothetical protein
MAVAVALGNSDGTGRYRHPMHLYAAFLGGPLADSQMGEGHEVVLVVAEDLKEARSLAKAKWGGEGRAHVDALQQIDMVDGFEVTLAQVGTGDRLTLEGYN